MPWYSSANLSLERCFSGGRTFLASVTVFLVPATIMKAPSAKLVTVTCSADFGDNAGSIATSIPKICLMLAVSILSSAAVVLLEVKYLPINN